MRSWRVTEPLEPYDRLGVLTNVGRLYSETVTTKGERIRNENVCRIGDRDDLRHVC